MLLKIPKGFHKEKRCFIIGSGPSMKGMDLSWLKDEVTICVNQSYKLLPDFDPTYVCISDENLWPLVKEKYARMNTQVVGCFRDTKKFENDYTSNEPIDVESLINEFKKLEQFNGNGIDKKLYF